MVDHLDAPRDDDVDALYDKAPCGYLSTTPDGVIIKVNQTFLTWTGYDRADLVDATTFVELLTVGERIYHETHYVPMLQLQGRAREIALDIVGRDGRRLPALVNATLERDDAGEPTVIRAVVFDATERRQYEQQLVLARQQAERAGADARRMAETLQKTLIPPELPRVEGLDLSAVYRPAGDGSEIGGDFYDVFQVSADHWVLSLGDVQGKGVDAAVVTALARHTIRAYAVEHHEPSAILQRLNTVLCADPTERLCTALVIALHRDRRGWHAVVSAGGHPLPMLTRSGAPPEEIGRPGSLLGFFETGTFSDVHVDLRPGDAFIAYTDGVTDARVRSDFFGDERVARALQQHVESAVEITTHLLDEVLAYEHGTTRDDIAIMAVRVESPSRHAD